MKKVTVIGGGTGSFVVLSGLKKYPLDLAVVVTMMDSGGSTGRLRDQLGILPPGDLRQCLLALSDAPLFWRKLFVYRFQSGDLAGHNFGNIFLSTLEKISDNYHDVVRTASYILKTKGQVIPVTFTNTHIWVKYQSGKLIKGEGNIDKNYQEKTRIIKAYLKPTAEPNFQAIQRINKSNIIIIGPGDFYSSIIPVLLVNGIKAVIQKSQAKIIYVLNLVTKFGQTPAYSANDHISDISLYLGRRPDIILINNGLVPLDIIKWYQSYGESLVVNDLNKREYKGKIIKADVINRNKFAKEKSDRFVDPMVRSILRHDSGKLAKVIYKIIS